MAITTEYLDSISFDIAKQKYYNANKVNAKMEEIKAAVAELITENELLRAELAEIGSTKEKIAELMISTQATAEETLDKARREAEQIVAEARCRAIRYYTKAIEADNDFAEAYFNRGLTYVFIGENEKGLADLSKAGELGIYQAYNLITRFK